MPAEPHVSIAAGNAALKVARWQQAREAFRAALELGESVEALFGLATASFWLGDMRGTIAELERAYALSCKSTDAMYAAGCALRLAFHYQQHLAVPSVASGWLARAARLVEDNDLAPLRGELSLMKAYLAEDPGAGEAWARQARQRTPEEKSLRNDG